MMLSGLLYVATCGATSAALRGTYPFGRCVTGVGMRSQHAPRMTLTPLDWRPEGHEFWQWYGSPVAGGSRVHFYASGPEDGRPLVLVHGFGASWFHWRRNVGQLSERYRVYAIDLVGFGLSDKPLTQYSPELWAGQLTDFVREVVAPRAPCKAAIAGNSLGGFASLAAAVIAPELIEGVALLNAAGQFAQPATVADPSADADAGDAIATFYAQLRQQAAELARRVVLYGSFQLTKQPARIKSVLQAVYSRDATHVDDLLVASIAAPAGHPNAAEVFYRIVSRNAIEPSTTIDALLARLPPSSDLLLLWGEHDPWIRPAAADKIMQLRPSAKRVSIDAGHCPHDEKPAEVNAALAAWMEELPGSALVLPPEPILLADRWPASPKAQRRSAAQP